MIGDVSQTRRMTNLCSGNRVQYIGNYHLYSAVPMIDTPQRQAGIEFDVTSEELAAGIRAYREWEVRNDLCPAISVATLVGSILRAVHERRSAVAVRESH